MTRFEIEVYLTEDGEAPFQAWLDAIASSEIRTQILARIRRASLGNFGDWKPLAGAHGIFGIHAGAGYRVFYTVLGNTVVLLLAGATKKDQRRTLERAKVCLEDYRKRMKP
ncbi:MAG: hypothetical protein ABS40_08245 [Agrobacterium sp. SCN 61-19]|nr:MAG: hypothetical protein ABS40_08245 [Agrobacterium sp. SCN 61-19]